MYDKHVNIDLSLLNTKVVDCPNLNFFESSILNLLQQDNHCIGCNGSHYDVSKKCYMWENCKNNSIKNSVLLMHLNIQGGFCKKIHDLQIFLESSNIDVICFNEHCLVESQINILSSLRNYEVGAYFCRENIGKGGSCILVKNQYDYKERKDFYFNNEEGIFEVSSIEIFSLNVIVISVYRTPYESNFKIFLDKLESLLVKLYKYFKTHQIYIAADFNVDVLHTSKSPEKRNMFLNLINMYGFNVNFSSPTRITASTSTCIDNIITNDLHFQSTDIKRSKMNLELGISDHRAIFIELNKLDISNKKINKKKRLFSKKNITHFCKRISEINWNLSTVYSAQSNFDNFLHDFINNFNFCFPLKFFSNKPNKNKTNKSWVTKGIKISSKRKRELSRIAKINKDVTFQNYYNRYRKIFKAVCDRARKLFNCKVISDADNKSKAVWSVVKSELGVSNSKSVNFPDLCFGDKLLSSGQMISDFLNNKFVNISSENKCDPCLETAVEFAEKFNMNSNSVFYFKHVTVLQVKQTIKSLKNKKSVGWDEIPIELVKAVTDFIAHPLCFIINKCFDEGIFPNQLKYAELKPIFKKGAVDDPNNYRPISLLPTFSKIFEKIACNQIYSFFDENKLFIDNQFGFRSGLSTISAVSDFIDQVSDGLDGSQSTAAVFCDLSKAFDSVNYDILLNKLKHYNFSDLALSWVQSYLKNRQQRTIITKNGVKFISDWQKIKCGVPQGSILGPLFFLIFMNDVPKNVSSNLILYADDTTAIVKASHFEGLKLELNRSLLDLSNWFSANGLKLNCSKTQIVKFQTIQNKQNLNFELNFNENILSFVEHTKFLGIHIDKNLTWKQHTEMVVKKLNTACFQMYVLRNIIDLKTKLMVYYALFFSTLQYGIELWGSTSHAQKVFKVQKKFLRILSHTTKRTSCKPLFKKYEILTMPSLYIFKILIYLKYNYESFIDKQFNHKYPTRFKDDLQYPRHRLLLFEKTPYYMSLRLYNNLPSTLKKENNISAFKRKLKNYLLHKTYYSVSEYLLDDNKDLF
jgi:hypothetical protein